MSHALGLLEGKRTRQPHGSPTLLRSGLAAAATASRGRAAHLAAITAFSGGSALRAARRPDSSRPPGLFFLRSAFIDDRPKHTRPCHAIDELLKADWLDHVRIDPQFITGHQIRFF